MQKNIDSVYYNQSGYHDPTAGRVLYRIIREEETAVNVRKGTKKRRKRKKKNIDVK